MNLRRGLFRLWLLGSIVFAAFCVIPRLPMIAGEFSAQRSDDLFEKHSAHPWQTIAETAQVAFGVPIAVFVIGAGLLWAGNGFRGDSRPN